MIIGAPTNNMLNIADDISNAKQFKLFFIDKYKIIREEYCENCFENGKFKINEFLNKVPVSAIITKNIEEKLMVEFNNNNIIVKITNDTIITNAINDYLKELILKESNYCCAP